MVSERIKALQEAILKIHLSRLSSTSNPSSSFFSSLSAPALTYEGLLQVSSTEIVKGEQEQEHFIFRIALYNWIVGGELTAMCGIPRFLGTFFKCARVGERMSPYVSLACVAMALTIMMGS